MFLFMTYGTFWKGCTSFKYGHRLISYSNCWALALMCTYSLVYPADLVCGCRPDVNECSIDSVNHIGDRHWYCRFHWLMAHNPHRSKFRIDSNNTEREKITATWVNCEYNISSVLTAILPLLRDFGRGTWKFLPSRSVRSSSSLELELSKVLMPFERELSPNLLKECHIRNEGRSGGLPL